MPKGNRNTDGTSKPGHTELLQLLAAAVDGIDGYESESGDLRYWNAASIDRARRLLSSLSTDPQNPYAYGFPQA
jgi:hypothetical protein